MDTWRFASFLVDRFCLGVKDVFCGFMAKSEYSERFYDGCEASL